MSRQRLHTTWSVTVRNDVTGEQIALRITAHTIPDAKLHAVWLAHKERGWETCAALADVSEVRP